MSSITKKPKLDYWGKKAIRAGKTVNWGVAGGQKRKKNGAPRRPGNKIKRRKTAKVKKTEGIAADFRKVGGKTRVMARPMHPLIGAGFGVVKNIE